MYNFFHYFFGIESNFIHEAFDRGKNLLWSQFLMLFCFMTSPSVFLTPVLELFIYYMYACSVPQLCLTLCDFMNCSSWGSTLHGILQARIWEWVAISFSMVFSWPNDQIHVSYVSFICRWPFFTTESPEKPLPTAMAYRYPSVFSHRYFRFFSQLSLWTKFCRFHWMV